MEETKRPGRDAAISRRDALKRGAAQVAGTVFLFACGKELAGISSEDAVTGTKMADGYDPFQHEWVYLVDIAKCIGCGSCVRACRKENQVPPYYFRTWVERYRILGPEHTIIDSPQGAHDGFQPDTLADGARKGFFVPKICNHCKFSPCTQLCPVGASFRSPDGVMLVDEKTCIGCGYCVQACPYGSRFIHPVKHVASKCTFCYHRITKGLRPACVEACPTGARKFGDARDPEDEVSRIVATQPTHVLKPELHTGPHCHYLGMSMEVR